MNDEELENRILEIDFKTLFCHGSEKEIINTFNELIKIYDKSSWVDLNLRMSKIFWIKVCFDRDFYNQKINIKNFSEELDLINMIKNALRTKNDAFRISFFDLLDKMPVSILGNIIAEKIYEQYGYISMDLRYILCKINELKRLT